MARICPSCAHPMIAETVDNVQLDACTNCGGLWFDVDELKTMMSASSSALEDLEHASPHVEQKYAGTSRMLCPIDEVLLESYHYMYNSPVVLHGCTKCGGFFVEASEVPKMEQSLSNEQHPSKLEEDKAIALAEFEGVHARFMDRQLVVQHISRTLMQPLAGWLI